MYGVNALGAEWRSDIEIGKKQRYATEFYQPLDNGQIFYIRPFLSYEKMTYIVPTDTLGNQELESTGYGGGVGFGANFTRSFRAELSFDSYQDKSIVELFDYNEKFNARQVNLKFLYDSLDNYNFPNSGLLAQLRLKKDAKSWGSDYDYEQVYAMFQKPLSYFDNSFIFSAKFGKTDIKTPIDGAVTVYDKFYLGGMFNLSGYQSYELVGNNVAFGNLMYRYRLKNGGFFGSLGMPMYAGVTLESGNVWDDGESFKSSDLKYSGSIYLSADTPLGSFYFTYGYADADHKGLYLTLGEKF
jgi:NTE family protein